MRWPCTWRLYSHVSCRELVSRNTFSPFKTSKRGSGRFMPCKIRALGSNGRFLLYKRRGKGLNARFLSYKQRAKGLLLVFCLINSVQKAFCSFSALQKTSKRLNTRFLPYKSSNRLNARFLPYNTEHYPIQGSGRFLVLETINLEFSCYRNGSAMLVLGLLSFSPFIQI